MPRIKKNTRIIATAKDRIYVGLDVHKKSIHVAVWKNDGLADAWVAGADYDALAKQLEPLRPAVRKIAYEAGPTGFVLARLLRERNFDVLVCAPSKTPQVAADEAKCDRLDARRLAEYAAKGLLAPVAIPTEREECERAVVRHRDHVVKNIGRVKRQIKSALLFHQCGELASWSRAERTDLLDSDLPDELRFELESLFRELAFFEEEKKKVEEKLKSILAQRRHAKAVENLESHPGVGPVVSGCFVRIASGRGAGGERMLRAGIVSPGTVQGRRRGGAVPRPGAACPAKWGDAPRRSAVAIRAGKVAFVAD